MNESLVMRCSIEDKAQLKKEAKQRGQNVSQLIREALINQKILPPTWIEDGSF